MSAQIKVENYELQENIKSNLIAGKLEFFRKEISVKTDNEHIKYLEKKFKGKTN